jgi:HKD family nuclease
VPTRGLRNWTGLTCAVTRGLGRRFHGLLTGTRLDPSLVAQLRKEIGTADRVDILCSFIKWSGVRILQDTLRAFTAQDRAQLRVITTSYLGAPT